MKVAIVGFPASGKTTLCLKPKKESQESLRSQINELMLYLKFANPKKHAEGISDRERRSSVRIE